MLKDLKSKRRLSLFVALALSAGGALFSDFQYAYAADVSGNDVLVDFTPAHPLPTVPPPSGGAITDPADNGNVYNNKLTVDGPHFAGQSLCGGFTAGAGNVTGNTVVVKNAAAIWGDAYVYGGFSAQGNATGNTVILGGNNYYGGYTGMRRHGLVYGGGGNNPSADHTTGNTLRVQGRLNGAYSISNFEKIEFDLTGLLLNGDWQLSLREDGPAFEWSNIKITELDDWLTALAANHINSIAIAPFASGGGVLTLTNYAPTFFNRGDYEVRKRADTTGTGTVNNIYTIFVEANRFQNAGHGVNVTTPGGAPYWAAIAGLSIFGNTTNHNELNITGGSHPAAYAGFTAEQNGGTEYNTLNLTGGNITVGVAGYTRGIHLLANPNDADHPELVDTTKNAYAKNNTVNINGGTLNANGKLYGGVVGTNPSLTVSAGDATGNIVNIESGAFGGNTEIYSGYTEGTGKATGNTINIGKSDGTLNAPTLSNAMLYGGGSSGSASDVVTDNTLNVNTNASVRNIANFGKVSFNFTSTFNQANPMLNVVGGAATDLNWDAIAYTGTAPVGRSILMQNMSNINLGATYMGAKLASLTDTHERVIDTNTGTGTAQQIYLDGYQFKSANVTPTTGSATEDVWAGRSVIGNTTTENVLTLNNGTTHRDAYGGWTAGTGTTAAAKDSSTGNTVNLVNSTVRNIYGGFTAAAGGNATGNKVNISGGTVSGTVHGGYLSHASATGDATGNIVTITGGTMSDVYGGWTAGTGATTGNTVNLGSETDAVASGTTIGKLYGGSKTTATDNTLNVYDSVTAGNIANFDKVNFKATSSHIAAGDTLLTLNDGNATTLDWNKLHVDDLDSLTADPTSDRILTLMENSSNIDFGTSYSSTGTRGRIHTDDYEADMTTDGNSATTTKVYLKGYRFQNNDTSYTGTTATDAWGGRSIIGNKVQKNKLTLTGGSATLNARGGMVENTTVPGTAGDAAQNKLILNTGAAAANAYGAEVKTKAGSATKNEVTINAGTVNGTVYGAALTHAAATGDATGNTVTITGGTMSDVYGGYTSGTGATTGNTVNLGDGQSAITATINGVLYGGNQTTVTDNTLNVKTNATAGNIAHFDKVKFHLNSTINPANSLLTLNNSSQTTGLKWDKLEVDTSSLTGAGIKTYEPYKLKLIDNAAGIATAGYTGAKDSSTDKLEYIIDTDSHAANATRYITLEGYQFKDNTATTYVAADGTHTEGWAGRTKVGNKVENNKLTVTGGTISAAAYGGLVENHKLDGGGNPLPTGDAEKNTVAVAGGTVANAYGAEVRTKDGSATENTAEITGGTVGSVYGASLAAANAAGSVTKSKVNISGSANITGNVYGGHIAQANATGNITGSTLNLTGGSVGGATYAAYNGGSGDAKDSIVNLTGGALHDVYGGKVNGTGAATGHTLNLYGGSVTGDVYGGHTNTGATTGNTVNLGDGTTNAVTAVTGVIYGGNKTTVTDNTLNVKTNATAGNIAHFDKVKFDLNSTVNPANSLLTLNNGTQTTDLNWNKIEVDTSSLTGAGIKTYEPYKLNLIDNAAGIATTGYTGAKDNSTDKLEYVIDTDNNTATATRYVTLEGYQFKDNTAATYAAADGTHTEGWAGRTKVGNKVENNKLTVTGGTISAAAYGGLVENNKVGVTTGDAEKNTISISGGTVVHAYGADVRTKDGNATENTADITGGTATNVYGAALTAAGATGKIEKSKVNIAGGNISGSVYGGQITDNGATGSITGSTITLTNGSIGGSVYGGKNEGTGSATGSTLNLYGGSVTGDVYGGHTASGATTGNTVNLGDGTTNAVTAVTGVLYGGNQNTVTDNVLNVKTNATAGNIAHFDKVKFDLNSTINPANSLLTLNNGAQTTGLNWAKLEVDTQGLTGAGIKTYEPYKLNLIDNAAGIATTGYTGAKDSITDKFEYIIDTDTHGANATQYITLEGYQFKDNSAATYTATDGTHSEAWAGRTKVGNKVENNKLNVTGGSLTTAAYGGLVENNKVGVTTGDAEKNTIAISGGTVVHAYGADVRTRSGNATENTADITGGTVTNVYGAALTAANATGTVDKSKVTITSGAVTGNVYGGHIAQATATGTVTNSEVNITGGSVGGNLYGGYHAGTGNATGGSLRIAGGTMGDIHGNYAATGSATGATVDITGGSMGDVYGGFTSGTGATTGNIINLGTETDAVAAGTTVGTIYGGNGSNVTGNTLNVNSRNVSAADVKNFENINFDAAHHVSHGDTMLTLTDGGNTSIDWGKMKLKNLDTITASPTSDHILTLLRSTNDVTFTNYDPSRARETKKDGDYEYVLNTDSETASAKNVDVTGYRFRNNHPTYSTGSNTEAWGGRSKVGNTVEKNSLDITGGTITTAAYAGLAQNLEAGDGVDGYKKTGDATENTLILNSGATIADGYGADVRTEAGNATKNSIDLKGANVTGNLYAGALTHTSASGSATDNTVNLYSGSVAGNVYGGFASGNGKTTDNTITIGDGTNDANVTVTGKLIGGNKSAEGNVLNLKSKGARVGSLENFGKITWSLGSNVADGDTVLTLNDDTALTYSTIEKPVGADVSNWLGSVMEKNIHLFQMAGGKTLTLSGYNPATGSERSNDVEYSLVTDNNQAVTTAGGSLDLTAYKWQNANVEVNSGAITDVFGGKTVYGTDGATKNNKLTLKTGANVTNAIAGDTQTANGTAEENILTVKDGSAVHAYGAKTKAGKATKNVAYAEGGTVTNLVGAQSQSGTAEENHVEVKGGSITNAIGAETLTVGDAANNKAIISAGSVTGSLKGAQSAGKAGKNTVDIKGGDISGASVIGAQASGNAEENTVTISGAPTSNAATTITGGSSTSGDAVKNVVNVNAAVTGNIVGGSTDRTTGLDAIENTVNVNANVTGDVYGGHAHRASLRNTVNIADGITVTGSVFGGSCITADGNTVNIGKGATITGDVIAGNATGTNSNNIIHLRGSRVEGTIKGGNGTDDHDNTLAIRHDLEKSSYAGDFTGINNLHFYLSEGIENENPTILNLGTTNKDIRGIHIGVGVDGRAPALKVNDVISLMKVAGNGTLTTDADSAVPPNPGTIVNHVEGMHGVSLLYGFDLMKRSSDELIATVTRAAISEQTKSFVETRAGATSFINGGADLLAGAGMTSAKKEGSGDKDKDARGYHLWAAMEQSGMTVKSGSYSDTQGYGLAVGWTRELGRKGHTLLFSPFVEYGRGKYDSYLDDGVHGSGKISYLGVGVMGRIENAQGLWAEAALHGGKTRSDYSGSLYTGTSSHYDSSNAYYAAHLGIGKEMKTNEQDRLNTYLRYFWSYQSGMQAKIHTGGRNASVDEYDFGAVSSNRVRLGFTYTHQDSDKSEIFAGLAWEYELSGKATASYQGYDTPSPSLRGGSGMLEVGYRFAPKDSRFSYDLRFTGWQGKRQGYSGGAHVNWAF